MLKKTAFIDVGKIFVRGICADSDCLDVDSVAEAVFLLKLFNLFRSAKIQDYNTRGVSSVADLFFSNFFQIYPKLSDDQQSILLY